MKLIFENWRHYLKEHDDPEDEEEHEETDDEIARWRKKEKMKKHIVDYLLLSDEDSALTARQHIQALEGSDLELDIEGIIEAVLVRLLQLIQDIASKPRSRNVYIDREKLVDSLAFFVRPKFKDWHTKMANPPKEIRWLDEIAQDLFLISHKKDSRCTGCKTFSEWEKFIDRMGGLVDMGGYLEPIERERERSSQFLSTLRDELIKSWNFSLKDEQ